MAQEAQLLVQNYLHAINEQDLEQVLQLVDDEVIHEINQGDVEIGREKFKRYMEHLLKCYKDKATNIFIMTDKTGKHASARFIIEGVYVQTDRSFPPANHQKYVLDAAAFFEIQAGKIKRISVHFNLPEWLRQVSH